VIDRLKQSHEMDSIVLATVNEAANTPLKAFARQHGIDCFWYAGHVDHVTTRLRRAAEAYLADICVLVSADCPLIHAPAIDRIVSIMRQHPEADTARFPADLSQRQIALQGIVANRIRAWQLADDLADKPELKEHQFPLIGLRPELFKPVDIHLDRSLYMTPHRLSVDTLADLDFMNAIYDELTDQGLEFALPEVVRLLNDRPDLKLINAHVHQRRLVENTRNVLFAIDAGGRFGYGHLMRSMELARQITERLGWPVHFLMDDAAARTKLETLGYWTHWGAVGRQARLEGDQQTLLPANFFNAYDLLVFDIFDQRGLDPDWRASLGPTIRCVSIENMQPWSRDADLIVFPNVLGEPTSAAPTGIAGNAREPATTSGPRIVGGNQYIVLRDEIRMLSRDLPPKSIDVLVYLHERQLGESLGAALAPMNINTRIVHGFVDNFSNDLARARVFVSAFGISFNEALAVGALPVCWPDSDAHRMDARRFYDHLHMTPLIVESVEETVRCIQSVLAGTIHSPPLIEDGTPNIVGEIARLVQS
jgi:spore coat polysaccharide biosynthesis protein SpsF